MAVKGAQGVFASRRSKVVDLKLPSGLLLNGSHQLRQGDPIFIGRSAGVSAEVADRLKMHGPHHRGPLEGLPQYVAQIMIVHTRDDRGNQHDPDVLFGARLDGPPFIIQQALSSNPQMDIILGPVKLEENRGQSGPFQIPRIFSVPSQPDPVGVNLNKGEPEVASHSYDGRQIIPGGRLASGKLDVAGLPACGNGLIP
jgi:hypothetical protein